MNCRSVLEYILDLNSKGFKMVFNPCKMCFHFASFKIKNIQIPWNKVTCLWHLNAEITSEFVRFPGMLRLLEIRDYLSEIREDKGLKEGGMLRVTLGPASVALTTAGQNLVKAVVLLWALRSDCTTWSARTPQWFICHSCCVTDSKHSIIARF